ncbi:exonuclease SbcCD subunit D C-terminal domain-containing protein [Reichenbachiella agariperforans]|uniref:exonuclease SbcCD subunit D C-terminal domain-containing protein n=1 Tax=Reichenbachiella agariperforans TaxID=156994 RepID=UPI001C0A58A8|nr:exonuclease SbcCD subunit D C-terminal domain-containing protein [Reichenbachiella agariperforans]MBU2913265.1 exonuclease SbcCD subunit D C-terminal domain-containing protein [Reichenbachiella agariperforans]
MRILHTSDWHIGQKLYGQDRYEEFEYMLDEMIGVIEENKVELLLISGDIFDVPSPSNRAQELYYNFIKRLLNTCCRHTIVTGGNHDSISTLNAPKEVLKMVNVTTIGGVTESLSDMIVRVLDKDGQHVLNVAAIPYLRDKDVRKSVAGQDASDSEKSVKNGLVQFYDTIEALLHDDTKPCIGMGHLFAHGATTSDSERDINIGNLGAVNANEFPQSFDYTALGHIHKPQVIGKNEMIRYSGSPLPLSFSERKDQKSVVLLNLVNEKLTIEEIIPLHPARKLVKFKGTFVELQKALLQYESKSNLVDWAEVEIVEEEHSPQLRMDFEAFMSESTFQVEVLKYRFSVKKGKGDTGDFFQQNKLLEDLKPQEVFEKRLANVPAEEHEEYKESFNELLKEMNEAKNEDQ